MATRFSSSKDGGVGVWLMGKGGHLPVAAGRALELPCAAGWCFPPCVLLGAASTGSYPGWVVRMPEVALGTTQLSLRTSTPVSAHVRAPERP